MRLGVPPTLKHSSLMDSNYMGGNSPTSSRGMLIRKTSKSFKDQAHSQFGQSSWGNVTSLRQQKQSSNIGTKSSIKQQNYQSLKIETQLKGSGQGSFIKKMPMFNQFQTDSNLSEIKISQIPKKDLDYQLDFDYQETSPFPSKLKRQNSSSEILNSSNEILPQSPKRGLKKMSSMDVINEEQSSNFSNSLTGSKKFQSTNILNDLRKTPTKNQKFSPTLQVIQQRQRYGANQSEFQNTQMDQSSKVQKTYQKIKKKKAIEVYEVQSSQQFSNNNSEKSCCTVNLVGQIDSNEEYIKEKPKQQNYKIKQKLLQIQKSLRLDQQSNVYDVSRTQTERSMEEMRLKSNRLVKNASGKVTQQTHQKVQLKQSKSKLKNSEEKILSNMNERFQRMKQIKNGVSQKKVSRDSNLVQNQSKKVFVDKAIQTDPYSPQSAVSSRHQVHSQYAQKLDLMQRQNSRLRKQIRMNQQKNSSSQIMRLKFEQENNFLNQKIKRLERILQKNQTELQEWKLIAKQGKSSISPPEYNNNSSSLLNIKNVKKNQISAQRHFSSKSCLNCSLQKQNSRKYILMIENLNKQLQKVRYVLSQQQQSSKTDTNIIYSKQKQYKILQRFQDYQQNLAKSMQKVQTQQQKIMKQWRMIEQFYDRNSLSRQDMINPHPPFAAYGRQNQNSRDWRYYKSQQKQQYNIRDYAVSEIGQKVKNLRNKLARQHR